MEPLYKILAQRSGVYISSEIHIFAPPPFPNYVKLTRYIICLSNDTWIYISDWGVGLLRLIGRYLYAQEGRPLLNTEKLQITHIRMIKGFYILILSQHILKTHEKRINVSVLVL